MTVEERIDRLTGIVESLAASVVAHDNQIEGLINVAEKHDATIEGQGARIEGLIRLAEKHVEAIANIERQWQAYINTLPRQ